MSRSPIAPVVATLVTINIQHTAAHCLHINGNVSHNEINSMLSLLTSLLAGGGHKTFASKCQTLDDKFVCQNSGGFSSVDYFSSKTAKEKDNDKV